MASPPPRTFTVWLAEVRSRAAALRDALGNSPPTFLPDCAIDALESVDGKAIDIATELEFIERRIAQPEDIAA